MNRTSTSLLCSAFALCTFAASSQAQWALDMQWNLTNANRDYLTDTDVQRGLSYNPTTGNLLLVDRAEEERGGLAVQILNGMTGDHVGSLSLGTDIISGGNFLLNKIGVGSDGAIYAGNLTTDAVTNPYRIYRWADESASPELIYSGDPSNGATDEAHSFARRWGDTLDVRGGGSETQILAGSRRDTFASVFTPGEGINFVANDLTTDRDNDNSGAWYNGIAFGDGDTFWGGASGRDTVRMGFDLGNNTGETLNAFGSGVYPHQVGPIGYDPVNSLLGGIRTGADPVPQEVFLYSYDQAGNLWAQNAEGEYPFPTQNGNGNASGDVIFSPDGTMMWVLGTNNGIMAFEVIPEPSTYALIFGMAIGGLLVVRRQRRAGK